MKTQLSLFSSLLLFSMYCRTWPKLSPLRNWQQRIFMGLSGSLSIYSEVILLYYFKYSLGIYDLDPYSNYQLFFLWPICFSHSVNMIRSTKEAPAHNWLEYICDIQETCCWRCFRVSEVFKHRSLIVLWFLLLLDLRWWSAFWSWHDCCRGENGELRVGVRRVARQQSPMPSSVISSQSMHLGVLATTSHAFLTSTMFVVYYKPRWVNMLKFAFCATNLIITM